MKTDHLKQYFSNVIPYSTGIAATGHKQYLVMAKTKRWPMDMLKDISSNEFTHVGVAHHNGKLEMTLMWLPETVSTPFYHEHADKPSIVVPITPMALTAAFWDQLANMAPLGRVSWSQEAKTWVTRNN